MGVIQSFERRLQGAVSATFARLFGGSVHPSEVAGALQEEAKNNLRKQGSAQIAPNFYTVRMGPSDSSEIGDGRERVSKALSDMIGEYLGQQGWQTFGDIEVALEESSSLHTGQFRISSLIDPDIDRRQRHRRTGVGQMSQYQDSGRPNPHPDDSENNRPADQQQDQGGYAPQGYDQGGYDQGGYQQQGGYDQGGYQQQGGYDPNQGGYAPQGYDQGGGYAPQQGGYQQQGGYAPQGYDQGGYQQGGYDPNQGGYAPQQGGHQQQGGYEQNQGGYAPQAYDQGGYQQGGYDPNQQGGYEQNQQGGYGQGGYQQDGFAPQQGGYDQGQQGGYAPQGYDQGGYAPQGYQQGYDQGQQGGYEQGQQQGYDQHQQAGYAPQGGYDQGQHGYGAPAAPVAEPVQDATAILTVDDGSHRSYQLQRGSNVVGRGQDAAFRLPDTSVSRRHIDIYFDGRTAVLHDLGSTNGSTVNGSSVQTWQLAEGDVIRIGHSTVVFNLR